MDTASDGVKMKVFDFYVGEFLGKFNLFSVENRHVLDVMPVGQTHIHALVTMPDSGNRRSSLIHRFLSFIRLRYTVFKMWLHSYHGCGMYCTTTKEGVCLLD